MFAKTLDSLPVGLGFTAAAAADGGGSDLVRGVGVRVTLPDPGPTKLAKLKALAPVILQSERYVMDRWTQHETSYSCVLPVTAPRNRH